MMKTDRQLLNYFYKKRNVARLEEKIGILINESFLLLDEGTSDETMILEVKEAQTVLEEIVSPKVQGILSTNDVKQPELKMYNSSLFQKSMNPILKERVKDNLLYYGF